MSALDTALLRRLTLGPERATVLASTLDYPYRNVREHLRILCRHGHIKRVGKRHVSYWALPAYAGPAPARRKRQMTIVSRPKALPQPKEAWWVAGRLDDAAFSRAQQQRAREMGWDR